MTPPRVGTIRAWLGRVVSTLSPRRSDRDLENELRSHLELAAEDARRASDSADDMAPAARRRSRGVPQAMEALRDQQTLPWLRDLGRDARYAVRALRRSPVFTAAAITSLALGIGATTAASTIVRQILLAPLPFDDSERLVRLAVRQPPTGDRQNRPVPTTYDEFLSWSTQSTTLAVMAATTGDPQVLTRTPSGAARLAGGIASPEWFDLLGTPAIIGRTLQPGDATAGRNVVVLSARTWRDHFAADPNVLGQSIVLHSRVRAGLEGESFEVVGVMPDTFRDPSTAWELDFWIPLARHVPGVRMQMGVSVMGRLVPGATPAAAEAEAAAILTSFRGGDAVVQMEAITLKEPLVGPVRPVLRVLMASVVLVLVIVCANVAGLLLARGTTRRRELAVRLAIGAGRGRIIRQLLAESAVLATAGGLAGVLVAAGAVTAVRALATIEASGVFRLVFGGNLLPRVDELTLDANVLALSVGLSGLASLLFGVVPALYLSRGNLVQATGGRSASPGADEHRARSVLVVAQIAVATILLVGAALLARSYVNLVQVDTGYDPTNVLAFQLVVPEDYPTARKTTVIETLLARLRATPGVRAAGFSYSGPLIGVTDTVGYFVPPGSTSAERQASGGGPPVRSISHELLAAIGARVNDGRAFDDRDEPTSPPVVVLNRSAARLLFGATRPVGSTLLWHGGGEEHAPVSVEVVGVVDDVRNGSVTAEPRPEVLFEFRQIIALQERWQAPTMQVERVGLGFMSFALRGTGDPSSLARHVREAVIATDPKAGIDAMAPLEHLRATSIARPRFHAAMLGLFAIIAGVLAAVGIYGLLSYTVAQRTHEIGVRMALGADSRAVLSLVLRRGLMLAGIGIAAGLAGAAGLSRWLGSLLYGLTSVDAVTYVLVAATFALVTFAACYLPARRATRVEPTVALRCD